MKRGNPLYRSSIRNPMGNPINPSDFPSAKPRTDKPVSLVDVVIPDPAEVPLKAKSLVLIPFWW